MGRGILAGLVWGSVVGFGIVTVANQVVEKVYVSPVSLSEEPANDDHTPQDQVADVADAPDAMDPPEVLEPSDVAETAPVVDDQDSMTAPAQTGADVSSDVVPSKIDPSEHSPDMHSDAVPDMSDMPDMSDTTPDAASESAPGTSEAVTEAETIDDVATDAILQPTFEIPDAMAAPKTEANVMPSVQGDSPVLGSPQVVELTQPATGTAPVRVDTKLPGQKPKPLGTHVEAPVDTAMEVATDVPMDKPVDESMDEIDGVDVVEEAVSDTTQSIAQNIADAMVTQAPVTPKVAPKIAPQGQKPVGTKVGNFTDRDDSMKSTRLPSVTGSAMADAAPVIAAEDLPAIVAFSADYTKAGTAPEMSVILVDIGEMDPTSIQLANLPFPVSFAVDALAPGASERAQMYRTAGLEVLALIGLPEGASAQDVAVTINQARDLVPVSIGFLDVPSASFQSTRDVAAQVVASASSSGHGIVSFSRGLNALMQESTRAEHPAALVFRDFDGRDQNLSAIKRFLDQAAFRAGIDEDIVLVGRAKEDTVKALVEWSLGNRAATVELVPVSFLLTGGGAPAQ